MAVVDGLSSGSMNTICRLPVGAPESRMTGMAGNGGTPPAAEKTVSGGPLSVPFPEPVPGASPAFSETSRGGGAFRLVGVAPAPPSVSGSDTLEERGCPEGEKLPSERAVPSSAHSLPSRLAASSSGLPTVAVQNTKFGRAA